VQPPPPAPPSPRSQAPGFHFRAGLLASAAAFAKPERASFGGALSLGVSSPGNWVLRAGVGRDLPITIASDYGEFAIQRSTASLSFGHVVSVRRFELELKAGAAGELVERGQPEAVDTATARGERSYTRAGGLVGLQARYRVLGPLAVELGLGASYFARRVRFVSAPEGGEIAQLWKIVPKVELGIELRLP
jgi:hypothetical protein